MPLKRQQAFSKVEALSWQLCEGALLACLLKTLVSWVVKMLCPNFLRQLFQCESLQARVYAGYPEEELQKLLQKQCSSSMQQRQEDSQALLASTQAVLDKQAAAWTAACAALGQLVLQLTTAHDSHVAKHAELNAGVQTALQVTKQVLLLISALHIPL